MDTSLVLSGPWASQGVAMGTPSCPALPVCEHHSWGDTGGLESKSEDPQPDSQSLRPCFLWERNQGSPVPILPSGSSDSQPG